MSELTGSLMGANLDRRSFLAATTASLAGLTLAGCAPRNAVTDAEEGESVAFESDGKWIPAACWLNCGGKCYNTAYVVDGVVKYQKTDDTHEDSIEMPQQRACPRGRSLRHMVYAPDRIRYPMKRVNWSIDEPNGELRGKDEWERISWDEALDYVAGAMKKAIEQDGNRSIVYPGWTFQHTFGGNILPGLGGCTLLNDTSSFGTYNRACSMLGISANGHGNDRMDLINCDYIVMYAANPAWASPGQPVWYFQQAKEAGVSFVYVGPSYNESANLYDARWIPVRPGTDTAFMLSVAYEMIQLDRERGNVIDWDFLDRCTVGFDADHMPADATLDENFQDYVLGVYDGIPKTAEWASEICGTPVEDIRWYAEMMGKENAVSVLHSFAAARCNDADDIPQLFMTIGAMGGHVGKPGHSTGGMQSASAGNQGDNIVAPGSTGIESLPNPVTDVIDAPDLWKAITGGRYRFCDAAMTDPTTVEEREIKIRVFYNMWRNGLQTIQGIASGIEALRTLDCVIHQGYDFNLTAQYADILLPTQTQWERYSPYFFLTSKGRELQIYPNKVIDPLWEAKSDEEIGIALLERFGVDPATVLPVSEQQQYFNLIAGSTVLAEDGKTYEPLVTITQEDLDRLGFEGEPQEGKISYDELLERGIYQVPRKEGDNYGSIALAAFREDPEANPLNSKSGKMEIYCQVKADGINAMGRSTVKPYPSYRPALHGYEESFSDWEGKVKGEYPFQMYNPHYLRRAHTGFDNVPQLREVLPNCVFLNADDAAEKGVEEGDTVRLWNGYAQCLRHATLTHRIMPGCVALPHGTWCDLSDDEAMDYSGSDNWMLAPDTSGLGVSGYNTNLVNFEKWTNEELPNDAEREFGPVGGIE